jgi:DNA-3-methyladenine glycosylase I
VWKVEKALSIQAHDLPQRCAWAGSDPLYQHYHDTEWGRPVADDDRLFEKLCLEGFQSGLSWITVLRKRERFRAVFHDFAIARVAAMTDADIDRLLLDAGIIRHRGKIASTINNAHKALAVKEEFASLGHFLWQFEPVAQAQPSAADLPAHTDASKAMSKALKKRGFTFVGPTTCYALMQAMGMVNDHHHGCDFHAAVEADRAAFQRP